MNIGSVVGLPEWWGTIPTWVSAAATSIGFALALVSYGRSQALARRQVANSVYCRYSHNRGVIVVENRSTQPVSNVGVFLNGQELAEGRDWINSNDDYAWAPPVLIASGDHPTVAMQFTDPFGQRWERTDSHSLPPCRANDGKNTSCSTSNRLGLRDQLVTVGASACSPMFSTYARSWKRMQNGLAFDPVAEVGGRRASS